MANYTLERDGWVSDECEGGSSEYVEMWKRKDLERNDDKIKRQSSRQEIRLLFW